LRVTAELVDARSGHQVDSHRFERPQAELFSLQDDITHHIVAALEPALKSAEADRARRSETESLDAWAIVNRAHIRLNQDLGDHDAVVGAIEAAREALRLDPEYGLAWAVLGLALSLAVAQRVDVAADQEKALEAARRAVQLDPTDAAVQHCLGATMGNLGRTPEAVRAYERALELDPNAAASYGGLGAALVFAKRAEDAKDALDRAIRLSPRDPLLYHWLSYRGLAELVVGRFEQARDDARASLDRVPGRTALAVLAVACANLGAKSDARAAYDALSKLDPETHPDRWTRLIRATAREDYELSQLVEGMWLASGLARDVSR
jgi:tetratricopeptide (TPR) repeat protein